MDGHDYAALTGALSQPAEIGKPTCVIANTTKGKGVSFMESVIEMACNGVPADEEMPSEGMALSECERHRGKLVKTACQCLILGGTKKFLGRTWSASLPSRAATSHPV